MEILKIYKDKDLKEEINYTSVDGKKIGLLDFGIVKVGDEKIVSYYIKNIHKNAKVVELKYNIDSPEVDILKYPYSLKPGNTGEIKIRYKPSVTIEKGLLAKLEISGGAILPPPEI